METTPTPQPYEPLKTTGWLIPKPSKQTVGIIVALVAALGGLYGGGKSLVNQQANRARTVTWVNGEQQIDWRPTVVDFRNTQFAIGITEDGFMVARPVKMPPIPQVRAASPEPANTNK